MDEPNYREITDRTQDGTLTDADRAHILELMGCETRQGPDGTTCRPAGETEWRPTPRFDSADDFAVWIIQPRGGSLCDIGMNDAHDEHYVSYEDPEFGNDYGYSAVLGSAMWAAFVKLVGKVGGDEDDQN